MRRRGFAVLAAGALTLALAPAVLAAETFTTELSGANQVPPLEVEATGDATVDISDDEQTVTWEVTYSGLTGAPAAGHIHVGAEGANGPVMIHSPRSPRPAAPAASRRPTTRPATASRPTGKACWPPSAMATPT